jgi:hypothetical protein
VILTGLEPVTPGSSLSRRASPPSLKVYFILIKKTNNIINEVFWMGLEPVTSVVVVQAGKPSVFESLFHFPIPYST